MATNELHVVFGATGGAGTAVVRELVAQGKRVRAVNRSGKGAFPPTVELVRADAADPASARAACEGATVVYNCANAPYTEWPTKFPPIVAGVIAGAASTYAKLVFADNLYMYGKVNGPITEATPYGATGRKGKVRIQLAQMLMDAHESGSLRVAIGRSADYYGPDVRLSLINDAFFRRAMNGKRVIWPGNLDLPLTQAYIDDVAKGLVTLGTRDEALGKVWHLPAASPITARQFITMLFEEVGQQPKLGRIPSGVIRIAGTVIPIAHEFAEMSYQYDAPFIVDSSKFERTFGVTPTSYRDGIRQTFAWLHSDRQTPVQS